MDIGRLPIMIVMVQLRIGLFAILFHFLVGIVLRLNWNLSKFLY